MNKFTASLVSLILMNGSIGLASAASTTSSTTTPPPHEFRFEGVGIGPDQSLGLYLSNPTRPVSSSTSATTPAAQDCTADVYVNDTLFTTTPSTVPVGKTVFIPIPNPAPTYYKVNVIELVGCSRLEASLGVYNKTQDLQLQIPLQNKGKDNSSDGNNGLGLGLGVGNGTGNPHVNGATNKGNNNK